MGKAIRRAIRDVGARLVCLPKYSRDLNPIEQVFDKFKNLAAKGGEREATKPFREPALRSPLNTRPQNALHTSAGYAYSKA